MLAVVTVAASTGALNVISIRSRDDVYTVQPNNFCMNKQLCIFPSWLFLIEQSQVGYPYLQEKMCNTSTLTSIGLLLSTKSGLHVYTKQQLTNADTECKIIRYLNMSLWTIGKRKVDRGRLTVQ